MMLGLGLELNGSKLKWLSNRWANDGCDGHLLFEGTKFFRSDSIVILGYVFRGDLQEEATIDHRIRSAWSCFNKWAHILQSEASMTCRIQFWAKTVLRSLLWGLQTTRALTKESSTRLLACQKYMYRRMAKVKRRPIEGTAELEPWINFQIRSMQNAGKIIRDTRTSVLDELDKSKTSWASHVSRMGKAHRAPHLIKAVLLWRPRAWWLEQRLFNELGWSQIKHPVHLGRPLRWEDQWSSNWPLILSEQEAPT